MNKHLKPLLFFVSLFTLLFPVIVSAQKYDYTELGEIFPSQCIWTTFDEEFDLLIPYLFTEQELTEEEIKDGVIYKSSFTDDGEEACHMTIIKDEFEKPVSEQELCEFLPTLRMDVYSARDIEILFYSLFPAAEDTHRTMIPDMDSTLAKLAQNFCM